MIVKKINKFKKVVEQTIELDSRLFKDFGTDAALIDFSKSIVFRKNNFFGKKLYFIKYEKFKNIFFKKYSKKFKEYFKVIGSNSKIERDSYIFFMWWQGINDETPIEVVQNLNSVKRNCGSHKVVVITKDNINEYIELPENIYEYLEKGNISLTHFSDILRVKLLVTYGGIWTDASFYWTGPLPEYVYGLSFFTLKHGLYSDFHISKGFWTVGLIGACKNYPLLVYIFDLFMSYLSEYDYFCCYLLMDVFIAIAYENWDMVKNDIDAIPFNNRNTFFLWDNGNYKFNEEEYKFVISSTSIFRNHPRTKKIFYTKHGEKTFYQKFYVDFLAGEDNEENF